MYLKIDVIDSGLKIYFFLSELIQDCLVGVLFSSLLCYFIGHFWLFVLEFLNLVFIPSKFWKIIAGDNGEDSLKRGLLGTHFDILLDTSSFKEILDIFYIVSPGEIISINIIHDCKKSFGGIIEFYTLILFILEI